MILIILFSAVCVLMGALAYQAGVVRGMKDTQQLYKDGFDEFCNYMADEYEKVLLEVKKKG